MFNVNTVCWLIILLMKLPAFQTRFTFKQIVCLKKLLTFLMWFVLKLFLDRVACIFQQGISFEKYYLLTRLSAFHQQLVCLWTYDLLMNLFFISGLSRFSKVASSSEFIFKFTRNILIGSSLSSLPQGVLSLGFFMFLPSTYEGG